jgi:hypothetical protein
MSLLGIELVRNFEQGKRTPSRGEKDRLGHRGIDLAHVVVQDLERSEFGQTC